MSSKIKSETELRAMRTCIVCGEAKDQTLVVCWNCFKHEAPVNGVEPLKYFNGSVEEWQMAIHAAKDPMHGDYLRAREANGTLMKTASNELWYVVPARYPARGFRDGAEAEKWVNGLYPGARQSAWMKNGTGEDVCEWVQDGEVRVRMWHTVLRGE